MPMKFSVALVIAATALIAATGAGATSFLNNSTPTGQIATPGSTSYTFNASAVTGTVKFELAGYRTLDGVNCCTDTLGVSLNGNPLLSASYNLGGGGVNTVFLGLPTVTFYTSGSPASYNGTANGGLIDITLVGAGFLAGVNTLTFTYSGANQGLGDEAWGINRVSAEGGVPEPASWALMVTGFALVGMASRRRIFGRVNA